MSLNAFCSLNQVQCVAAVLGPCCAVPQVPCKHSASSLCFMLVLLCCSYGYAIAPGGQQVVGSKEGFTNYLGEHATSQPEL